MSLTATEQVILKHLGVYVSQQIPRGVLNAQVHGAIPLDSFGDYLAATLTAYVLHDQGGEVVTESRTVGIPVQPWWIPSFLWRRLKVKHFKLSVSAKPVWTYPNSSIAVPKLGDPVRLIVEKTTDWRGVDV